MNIKELAEGTSGPVRAALLALEAKVMMLEHDLAEERAKNDPLADVLKDFGGFMPDADDFRAALDARGLEIRTKANDQ
jgi:hypothetical protein